MRTPSITRCSMWSVALILATAFPTVTHTAVPSLCSVGELRNEPGYRYRVERIREFVDSATVIVRAVAVGVDTLDTDAFDPRYRREPAVVFRPLEALRGTVPHDRLVFPGTVVDRDDFNPDSVPYTIVRLAGQRGDCEAKEYRLGAEYLFILRPSRRGGLTPHWRPLAPFNEQVRDAADPWVEWVRARVRQSSASQRGA
jgi:hypothetical protein